jgi:hypothetical protein
MQSLCAVLCIYDLSGCTAFFHNMSQTARFLEKILKKCVFIFCIILSETFLILKIIQRDIIIKLHRSLFKYLLFLSDFNETWIFSTDFRKILSYQISWKPVEWEPNCSMRLDRRIDITKLIVAFRNFAKAPKTLSHLSNFTIFHRVSKNNNSPTRPTTYRLAPVPLQIWLPSWLSRCLSTAQFSKVTRLLNPFTPSMWVVQLLFPRRTFLCGVTQ